MGILALFFVFLNVTIVNATRHNYLQAPDTQISVEKVVSIASSMLGSDSFFDSTKTFLTYSLNRWVGIEGVMATVAYEGKGIDLLAEGIREKPVKFVAPMYSEIGQWPHTYNDANSKTDYMFLVGGVGFLNYSGSLFVVFFFTLLISSMIQIFELLTYRLTSNPFLCATLGWMFSLAFVHSSGAPISELPRIQFSILVVLLIAIVQSRWLGNIIGGYQGSTEEPHCR